MAFCTRLFSWVRRARSCNDEHESFTHACFLRETSFYLWLVTYVVSTVKCRGRNCGLYHSKKPNFQRVGILVSVVFVVLFFWQPEAFYNVDEANTYLSLAPEKISLTSSAVLSLFTHWKDRCHILTGIEVYTEQKDAIVSLWQRGQQSYS